MTRYISHQAATQRGIDRGNLIFAKFFPEERMCPRLKNWLYICLVRRSPSYNSLEYRQNFVLSPPMMLDELSKCCIDKQMVARIRAGGYVDESKLEWLERTDVFLTVFVPILNKLNHPTITPITQNASNYTACLMVVDSMAGDQIEKESTLLLARKEWIAFKEIINIFTWARKDKGIISISKIRQAAQELGVERAGSISPEIQHGYWPGFVSYIFSLEINIETARKISAYAKNLIRQSTRKKTKGKGQVNVLIDDETIKKLEKICKEKRLSKAKLITEFIDNYNYYPKEIDAAIQRAKMGVFRIEDTNPPEIISGISRATSSQSDINVDKTSTEIKNETNLPDIHPNTSTQRPHEPSISQDDHPASITFENTHGVVEKIPDETSPKTTNEYSADPKGKLWDQDLIKIKFGHPFLYKQIK